MRIAARVIGAATRAKGQAHRIFERDEGPSVLIAMEKVGSPEASQPQVGAAHPSLIPEMRGWCLGKLHPVHSPRRLAQQAQSLPPSSVALPSASQWAQVWEDWRTGGHDDGSHDVATMCECMGPPGPRPVLRRSPRFPRTRRQSERNYHPPPPKCSTMAVLQPLALVVVCADEFHGEARSASRHRVPPFILSTSRESLVAGSELACCT